MYGFPVLNAQALLLAQPCTYNCFVPRPVVVSVPQGFGEAHTANPKVVSDMTSLHHIHEAGILYNLRERSKLEGQRPYTFMVSFIRPTFGVDLKAMIVCDI